MSDNSVSTVDNPVTAKPKIKVGEKIAFCVGEIFGGGGVVLMDAFFLYLCHPYYWHRPSGCWHNRNGGPFLGRIYRPAYGHDFR